MATTTSEKAAMDAAVRHLIASYSPHGNRVGWLMMDRHVRLPRAGRRNRIRITTSLFSYARCPTRAAELNRLADICTGILYESGECIHAIPFHAASYNERTPLMHEIREDGVDL
jgi:hypothetical protein